MCLLTRKLGQSVLAIEKDLSYETNTSPCWEPIITFLSVRSQSTPQRTCGHNQQLARYNNIQYVHNICIHLNISPNYLCSSRLQYAPEATFNHILNENRANDISKMFI